MRTATLAMIWKSSFFMDEATPVPCTSFACAFKKTASDSREPLAACERSGHALHLTEMSPALRFFLAAIFLSLATSAFSQENRSQQRDDGVYEFRTEHDRDGIGKFYMGREIAHVMGHQA